MLPGYKVILNLEKKLIKTEDELALCKKELEKTNKIREDHAERLRILEIAVQKVIDQEKVLYQVTWGPQLNDAIVQSHEIAKREY